MGRRSDYAILNTGNKTCYVILHYAVSCGVFAKLKMCKSKIVNEFELKAGKACGIDEIPNEFLKF
jgi:hypothetical protein